MASNNVNVKHKVIIDTDIGDDVDDALAIAFAMLRPELDVRLISTVFGPAQKRREIVDSLLNVIAEQEGIEHSELPKIIAGFGEPLCDGANNKIRKNLTKEPNQYRFALDYPVGTIAQETEGDMLDLFECEILRNPGEVTLVTIGAMTNAARFIVERPEAAKRIKCISAMGGSFLEDKIEYNVKCDPEAARIVMESDIPVALFSWETSGKLRLLGKRLERLKNSSKPVAQALARFIELWWPTRGKKNFPVIYDVSPLLWLFRPELYRMEICGVSVNADDSPQSGLMSLKPEGDRRVAMDMDEEAAADIFIETVLG